MNSKPKSNLEESDNTVIEVLQDETFENSPTKYVLIKHDYYSSDSDHGKDMLSVFLEALSESSFHIIVYLVDTGTRLLDVSNPLNAKMLSLIDKSELIIADMESLYFYNVNHCDYSKIEKHSMKSISEDLIYLSDLLVLE